MILAHLPSGYLLARGFGARRGPLLWAALAGAVAPDLDMLWFHLVDQRAIHHHRYWVHAPGFWALIGLVALPLLRWLHPVLSFLLHWSFLAEIVLILWAALLFLTARKT